MLHDFRAVRAHRLLRPAHECDKLVQLDASTLE